MYDISRWVVWSVERKSSGREELQPGLVCEFVAVAVGRQGAGKSEPGDGASREQVRPGREPRGGMERSESMGVRER